MTDRKTNQGNNWVIAGSMTFGTKSPQVDLIDHNLLRVDTFVEITSYLFGEDSHDKFSD